MDIFGFTIVGILGVALTIFYGVRAHRYEEALRKAYRADLKQRELVKELFDLRFNAINQNEELKQLRKQIDKLNELQDKLVYRDVNSPLSKLGKLFHPRKVIPNEAELWEDFLGMTVEKTDASEGGKK
ncbi:MAG: hypothetical protein OEZ15_09685 [Gammaproteobacteria bacterium]|nr:hypothetical protein [Gammaproteobacteria bacterium]